MQIYCRWVFLGLLGCSIPSLAQQGAAALLEEVGVDQQLGVAIPRELSFVDRNGSSVNLGELIDGKVTILVPVYYSCAGLCTTILGSVIQIIDGMSLELGKDYQVVNVSFDPTNTPELALAKAENYGSSLSEKNQKAAEADWRFLTGDQENIAALMNKIGFHYKRVGEEYSHAAALVVLTPDGHVSRYLTGIGITPKDARFALIEASDGKIGSPVDLFISYCYRYDPTAGKYAPLAWRIMRIGCLLVLTAMLVGGFFLWKSELVRKRRLEHNV